MEINKQIQEAGNNSQQIQAQIVTINNGVSEASLRNIFSDVTKVAIQQYTEEALNTAYYRINQLENTLIAKVTKLEKELDCFADPKFQLLLRKAQISATMTDKEENYDLLSELLICHIEKSNNKILSTGVDMAISTVEHIDLNTLCALTLFFFIKQGYSIATPLLPLQEYLKLQDALYAKLMFCDLPQGTNWIDHLETLRTIRIHPFLTKNSFYDYYRQTLDGYICVGIKKDSCEYEEALNKLKTLNLNNHILVDNELLEDYVRLAIPKKTSISEFLVIENDNIQRSLTEAEIACLNDIFALYVQDQSLLDKVFANFIEQCGSFEIIQKLNNWWDTHPVTFSLTQVGIVLAHTNLKRLIPDIPPLTMEHTSDIS